MTRFARFTLAPSLLLLTLATAMGATAQNAVPEPVLELVRSLAGEVTAGAVRASPAPGLYEVRVNEGFLYVTQDGRFFVYGDLYDAHARQNLTDLSRRGERRAVVEALEAGTLIVFAPEAPVKHVVTVFTDVDCPYCAKFHLEVPELNALGVEVRYAAWPRTAPGTESYARSISVWCASDRHRAITDAKAGRAIEPAECDNPVSAHVEAGERVGVRGTPTLVTETGDLIGGYVPYAELVQRLERG